MGDQDRDCGSEPASPDSSASSQSLLSRHLFATANRVTALEQQIRGLVSTVEFQEDKISNLEHQRSSLERTIRHLQTQQEGLAQQVLALETELQATRRAVEYRSAEAVTHEISVTRVGRRVAELERRLQLHGFD